MPSLFELVPLILAENLCPQRLPRTPEPKSVMDGEDSVLQYDQALSSKLALVYALSLELIYRARDAECKERAIDLACGPGHFTLQLKGYLNYHSVVGIDLSSKMIALANEHAHEEGYGDTRFHVGDVAKLSQFADESFDLATFCDAAHHMPDLSTVSKVLEEMERITKPSGLIYVIDLVRFRTEWATMRYLRMIGQDYLNRGLDAFFDDFESSMFAAWTSSELLTALPSASRRIWWQCVPVGLPTVQILVGLPVGQTVFAQRDGVPWSDSNAPFAQAQKADWRMLQWSTRFGRCRFVGPR